MREYETHPPFHLSADVNRIDTQTIVNGLKGVQPQVRNLYLDGLIRELEKERRSIKGTRLIKLMRKQLKRTAKEAVFIENFVCFKVGKTDCKTKKKFLKRVKSKVQPTFSWLKFRWVILDFKVLLSGVSDVC